MASRARAKASLFYMKDSLVNLLFSYNTVSTQLSEPIHFDSYLSIIQVGKFLVEASFQDLIIIILLSGSSYE
jgi:hypothetical protein